MRKDLLTCTTECASKPRDCRMKNQAHEENGMQLKLYEWQLGTKLFNSSCSQRIEWVDALDFPIYKEVIFYLLLSNPKWGDLSMSLEQYLHLHWKLERSQLSAILEKKKNILLSRIYERSRCSTKESLTIQRLLAGYDAWCMMLAF